MQNQKIDRLDAKIIAKISKKNYINTVNCIKLALRKYSNFKMLFFSGICFEICFFLYMFVVGYQTSYFAILLGLIFLTIFSFLILQHYVHTKTVESIYLLKDKFIASSRQLISIPKEVAEHHLTIAKACITLSSYLHDLEYKIYSSKTFFNFFCKQLSLFFHKDEIYKLKENLLLSAVLEHLDQINISPTDIEVHSSLAHTYLFLSKHYEKMKGKEDLCKKAAKLAIEEFLILQDFAPNDPWIKSQLAKCYHDLEMREEEEIEYESILSINPKDYDILFKLGLVCFELGKSAKGLRIYERLKDQSPKVADSLIIYYKKSRQEDLFEY